MEHHNTMFSSRNYAPLGASIPSSLAAESHPAQIKKRDGSSSPFDKNRLHDALAWASRGYEKTISLALIMHEAIKNMYDGITKTDIEQALILGTIAFIEQDPSYSKVAARLLLRKLFKEVISASIVTPSRESLYRQSFINSISTGLKQNLFDQRLAAFDLNYLATALRPEHDELFEYMGLKTLYERYFARINNKRMELPQVYWMRIAMGLAINEPHKNERAVEFYETMATLRYIPSTPTLLHSGLTIPQLSSCFLTTVEDDLKHIFKCLGDNAQLSKWSGGLANDWSNIRSVGTMIKSIKTESQGVIPFLKIANDVTAAINRSGKRRGASVVYLETWHLEIEDFLDLRKNTGDERRRTHDISTAVWIPDLFMKRVLSNEKWTLFSPHEVPELHHMYGKAFEEKYSAYEQAAAQGKIEHFIVVEAQKLWKKILSRLFETGHPWITFKDPSNIRSPQDHAGVVHSSNLCTEITLNTSAQETAVCNLGSVNLDQLCINGKLDDELLAKTVKTAMRMLDNVIDLNFYPTEEAQYSNLKHRPVGLGVMGFQDALFKLDLCFEDKATLEFADSTMEKIAYNAILASSELAKERGAYASYQGSKWNRDIFPQDTIDLLEQERDMKVEAPRGERLDWAPVREHVKKYGMRNSNTMAIAPTATISNISGCFPCIEPIYKNIYVKANMTGEFTVVNHFLVEDLKALGLWDLDMLEQLKYYDGNVSMIDRVPQHIKDKYKEAFEIDQEWLLEIQAARGRWVDQSISHNIFMKGVSGKKLHDIYTSAWKHGLKTTYYLRSLGATQIEKATLDAKKFGFTQKREYAASAQTQELSPRDSNDTIANNESGLSLNSNESMDRKACSITMPDCESCQ